MRIRPVGLAAVAVAVLLSLALPGQALSPLPGNVFQTTPHPLFLAGPEGSGGKLLALQAPASQSHSLLLLPGLAAGPLQLPGSDAWTTATPWAKDMEMVGDARAALHFILKPQAVVAVQARLLEVAADGTTSLVGQGQGQFAAVAGSQAIRLGLDSQGAVLHQGSLLRLEVAAATSEGVALLAYGGNTPSGIEGLEVRWRDSDGDGVSDSDEVASGSNPLDPTDQRATVGGDADGDGCADAFEAAIGTHPNRADSDNDGFGDCVEVHAGTDPLDPASKPYDVNRNNLPDVFETRHFHVQVSEGGDGVDPSGDPDGDGCDNLCEAAHGTDPRNPDTDGDGVSDGKEIRGGTDPFNADSRGPGPGSLPEPVAASAFFAIGSSLALASLFRRSKP